MSASNLEVDRGTTVTISGVYTEGGVATDITGASIRFTVKPTSWDTDADDSDATITKAGSIVDASAGTYSITLTDTDTYVDPDTYYYDIKIELASGTIHKLSGGKFKVLPTVTNRTS